ncbi:MAG TPA: S41 family peptidase [Candidatus Limnocylindrales bacterium]
MESNPDDQQPVEREGVPPPPADTSAWADEHLFRRPRRRISRRTGSVIAGLVVVAIAFGSGLALGRSGALPSGQPSEFGVFWEAWAALHDQYVDPKALDSGTLTYGAIRGMVDSVGDTGHTTFLSPDELAAQKSSLSGSVTGIGVRLSVLGGVPIIQSVIPNGPAAKAGLRSGDTIEAVDGTLVEGKSLDQISGLIRGQPGTDVKLRIGREGVRAPLDFTLTRAKVEVPAVSWAMVPGTTVADVFLEEFSQGATDEVKKAIGEARDAGAKAVILDLRQNPGGLADEAVGVTSQFLTSGNVYQERDRNGHVKAVPVQSGGVAPDLPLSVVVDNGTASSAEIVAGALQDAGRAKVVGERTFGTGTVLHEVDLSDGSALLIGVVEWLTRNGRQIWHVGIPPDKEVPLSASGRLVSPDELAGLGWTGIVSTDGQLAEAVKSLGQGG